VIERERLTMAVCKNGHMPVWKSMITSGREDGLPDWFSPKGTDACFAMDNYVN
jgi:hypothetical protein